jgi:TMEM175 potassium channel family protein
MSKGRLEAFSDGVIAILITIMVLELRAPHGTDWEALRELASEFFTYALSFVFLGIYWNNHHHLLHAVSRVDGAVMWANLHLLFWLSLTPFVTSWMGGSDFAPLPTAMYGGVLLLSGIAYFLLVRMLLRIEGPHSALARAIGRDAKGKISPALYAAAIPIAFISPMVAFSIYVFVAGIWFVPDRRLASTVAD